MKFLYSTRRITSILITTSSALTGSQPRALLGRFYAHEIMDAAPYDGLLVAMSAVRHERGSEIQGALLHLRGATSAAHRCASSFGSTAPIFAT
jgi:hypothetical protein